MKSLYKSILPILLVACLFTACAVSAKSENSTEAEIPEDFLKNEPKIPASALYTINLWHPWETGDNSEILESYARDFEKTVSSVKMNVTLIPYAEFTQKVMINASSGIVPELFIYANNETNIWADAGIIQDISVKVEKTGFMKNAYPAVKETHIYNGKYYGIPVGITCLNLFYNTDVVKTPPDTWEDLLELSKSIKTDSMYCIAVSAIDNEQGTFQFLPWLWSAGADIDSIDSPRAIKALSYWKELIDIGAMSRNVIKWSQQDVRLEFTSGRTAMMINGPWCVPSIEKENPNLKWAVTNIPRAEKTVSILGGTSFGIGKGADVDKVWQFIEYIYEPERNREFLDKVGHYSGDAVINKQPFYQEDPIRKAFTDQITVAEARLLHPKYLDMSKAIQVALGEALSGEKTSEEALNGAAKVINPYFEQRHSPPPLQVEGFR